ncbi:MAG: YihY/virulence factor BrkB family protein [Spirochaetales bacterium]|nr:YihY/virulence factor BrkB family protein [Spirochaetales bacterium]
MDSRKHHFRLAAQGLAIAIERFGKRELANHAAAGAYGFLLSAAPAVLVVFWLTTLFLPDPGVLAERFADLAAPFLGGADPASVIRALYSQRLGYATGFVAILSLLWTGRVFVLSIQRGLRVVHGTGEGADPVRENVWTIGGEIVVIVVVVAVLLASSAFEAGARFLARALDAGAPGVLARVALDLASTAVLFLVITATYGFLPARRAVWKRQAAMAALCVATFEVGSAILRFTINVSRVGLLYGVLGNLVVALLNVYLFFSLYYFFAELDAVLADFDALVFTRYQHASRGAKGLERWLYGSPPRLMARYGRVLTPGESLFREGDDDPTAWFLSEGSVGIYLGREADPSRLTAVIKPGELFGEMAFLLGEKRSATAAAIIESTLVALPPAMFERVIACDARASRRIISALANRLRDADRRMAADAVDLDGIEEAPGTDAAGDIDGGAGQASASGEGEVPRT